MSKQKHPYIPSPRPIRTTHDLMTPEQMAENQEHAHAAFARLLEAQGETVVNVVYLDYYDPDGFDEMVAEMTPIDLRFQAEGEG